MEIKNEQGLKKVMEKLVDEALEDASDEVIEIFKKDYILKYVYIDNPKMYQRTNDFLNAWNWTPIKKEINKISKEMWYNPGMMSSNIDLYQHGSVYSRPPVVIASLMEILDKAGRSSSLWLSNGVDRKEPYWKKFIEDMFKGGMLDKILAKHFSKRGFVKI